MQSARILGKNEDLHTCTSVVAAALHDIGSFPVMLCHFLAQRDTGSAAIRVLSSHYCGMGFDFPMLHHG